MLDGEDETEIELDELDQEEIEQEAESGADEAAEVEAEEEGLTVEIDGYAPDEDEEKPLVKKLRDQIRDRDRRIHELSSGQPVAQAPIVVGEEPSIDSPGIDWDPDKFKEEWGKWNERKQSAAKQEEEANKAQNAIKERIDNAVGAYRKRATTLGIKDFDELERGVASQLPVALQNAIPLYLGERDALTVVALARHPKLLDEIVNMQDPVAQLLRIKEISMGVKTVQRKPPAPERGSIPQGSAAMSGSADKTLARLEREAEKTGNRTELIRYRQQLRDRK